MSIKKVNLIITSIATLLYLVIGTGTALVAPLSVMAFDAPGSDKTVLPWIFLFTMLSWPLMFVLSTILSWIFYKRKRYRLSLVLLLLPIMNLLVLICIFSGIFTEVSFAP